MANPVQCNDKSLPISLDLQITVTRTQILSALNLSIPVFVSSTGDLTQGAGRIRYYDTLTQVSEDWGTNSEAYFSATQFFEQSPRPSTLAIAQAFSSPVAGFMVTGETGNLSAFTAITDGSFTISIDSDEQDITGLDFSSDVSLDEVADTLETALQLIGTGGYTAATVVASNATANQFTITSGVLGDGSTVSVLSAVSPSTGTDISGSGFLNGQSGSTVAGYTPTTFSNELTLISEAASCSGQFVYGWVLDKTYRDTQDQLDAATWAESELFAVMFLTSNDVLALDADNTTNNVYSLFDSAYISSCIQYHDNDFYYPGMSLAAYMLSVDYAALNSAVTAKFKNFPGVPTVGISESELSVLESRRGNVFVPIGNGARTYRQGEQSGDPWFTDDKVNIDNFVNDLLTNVYNVFLTTKKVPYTSSGITLLFNAEQAICDQYVRNGVYADRTVIDSTSPSGFSTLPAYQIIFPNLADVTLAERAVRNLEGNQIIVQFSGAIHQMTIDINIED